MEDVLAVYMRPRDPDRVLVCLDETSKQLIAETRAPIPMKPGPAARVDCDYERNGTSNLFMLFAPLEGWRHVKVTDRHTAIDYAHVLKDLADSHFPRTKTIVLIQDNLNIHSKASLYEAFPFAPRLVRVALQRRTALVGDDGDRGEVVSMEIARGDTGAVVGVRHPHPKHAVASSYGHGHDQDSSAAESPPCR
jgi:DDE superfamily endonuclease